MFFRIKHVLIAILTFLLFTACKQQDDNIVKDDMKIASVFDHDLYLNSVPDDIKENGNPIDSAALVSAFTEQWVRKMLLLHEAEKRKPESLDIEQLVEDYKQSLLINNLEKQVISEELDTVVSENELEKIYEIIKENFVQEYPIIELSYYKIPESAPQIDKFYEWWKKKGAQQNEVLCRKICRSCC